MDARRLLGEVSAELLSFDVFHAPVAGCALSSLATMARLTLRSSLDGLPLAVAKLSRSAASSCRMRDALEGEGVTMRCDAGAFAAGVLGAGPPDHEPTGGGLSFRYR